MRRSMMGLLGAVGLLAAAVPATACPFQTQASAAQQHTVSADTQNATTAQ